MARISALLVLAVIAVAMVCGAASLPASEDAAVLHRVRRFSLEGIVTCLAGLGIAGLPSAIQEVEQDCRPLGNNIAYRVCALAKLAELGPEYLKCVVIS